MSLKRVNYFTHQFLREQDFKDEQEYHVEARRRHNRLLHSWGVVEGLEVEQHGEHEIFVQPGYAVDKDGREIVLSQTVSRNLTSFGHDSEAYVTLSYHEEMEDEDHLSAGGVEGYTRIQEIPEIHEHRKEQLEEGSIVLARVRMGTHGHIEHVDMSANIRKSAKETSSSSHGWLRVPFKPVRLNTVRIGTKAAPGGAADLDFIVDEANAYCGDEGARGSMQIPVPPGAAHISGFRVAGSTRGEVIVRLFRTGWNVAEGTGEKTKLLEETLLNGSFHKEVELNASLDESHALAVSIRAEGPAEIWLVAVKF
jgi:hypothetical protein